MLYADNQWKFVIVMNKKAGAAQLMNAVAHLALGMSRRELPEAGSWYYDYTGPDDRSYAMISHWPVIVLKGNGNQLKTLYEQARELGLSCQTFVDAMLGASAEEQMRQTRERPADSVEVLAVMLFGDSETLRGLTKKFSLYNGDSSPAVTPTAG